MLITQVKRKEKGKREKGRVRVNFPPCRFRGGRQVGCQRQQIPDQAVFILESPWNDGFLPFQLIEDGSQIKEGRGAIDEFFTLWLTVFQSVQRNCISSIRVRIVFASCHSAIFHSYSFRYYVETVLSIPRCIFLFPSNIFLANLHFPQPPMTSSFLLICILNAQRRSAVSSDGIELEIHSAILFSHFSSFVMQDSIYVRFRVKTYRFFFLFFFSFAIYKRFEPVPNPNSRRALVPIATRVFQAARSVLVTRSRFTRFATIVIRTSYLSVSVRSSKVPSNEKQFSFGRKSRQAITG